MTKLYVDKNRASLTLVSNNPIEETVCTLHSAQVIDEGEHHLDIGVIWAYGGVKGLSGAFRFSKVKGFVGTLCLYYVDSEVTTELYPGYQKLLPNGIVTALEGEPKEPYAVSVLPPMSQVYAMATKPLSWQLDISQETLVFNFQLEDIVTPMVSLKTLEIKPHPDKPDQHVVTWFIESPDFLFCSDILVDKSLPNSAPKVLKHHALGTVSAPVRYWGNFQGVFVPLEGLLPVDDHCGDSIIVVTPKLLGLV